MAVLCAAFRQATIHTLRATAPPVKPPNVSASIRLLSASSRRLPDVTTMNATQPLKSAFTPLSIEGILRYTSNIY
jgi:hypothetical protein